MISYSSKYRILAATLLIAVAAMLHVPGAAAQSAPYKFDIGVQLGMSGYIGEASGNIFRHPGFDGEVSFRYIGDARWAIRGVLSTLGLSGTTADMDNYLPGDAQYSFTSQVTELSARGEFNFFAYGIGETYKRLRRWSPYITLGIGVAMSAAGGTTSFAATIPMGMGIKYKVAERWNLALEFTMTKAFSDHFDGQDLADLNQIKTAFYRSTDWYSRLTVGVAYEFGKRCETCHYVD